MVWRGKIEKLHSIERGLAARRKGLEESLEKDLREKEDHSAGLEQGAQTLEKLRGRVDEARAQRGILLRYFKNAENKFDFEEGTAEVSRLAGLHGLAGVLEADEGLREFFKKRAIGAPTQSLSAWFSDFYRQLQTTDESQRNAIIKEKDAKLFEIIQQHPPSVKVVQDELKSLGAKHAEVSKNIDLVKVALEKVKADEAKAAKKRQRLESLESKIQIVKPGIAVARVKAFLKRDLERTGGDISGIGGFFRRDYEMTASDVAKIRDFLKRDYEKTAEDFGSVVRGRDAALRALERDAARTREDVKWLGRHWKGVSLTLGGLTLITLGGLYGPKYYKKVAPNLQKQMYALKKNVKPVDFIANLNKALKGPAKKEALVQAPKLGPKLQPPAAPVVKLPPAVEKELAKTIGGPLEKPAGVPGAKPVGEARGRAQLTSKKDVAWAEGVRELATKKGEYKGITEIYLRYIRNPPTKTAAEVAITELKKIEKKLQEM